MGTSFSLAILAAIKALIRTRPLSPQVITFKKFPASCFLGKKPSIPLLSYPPDKVRYHLE